MNARRIKAKIIRGLLIIILFTIPASTTASHVHGAEITYECLGGLSYKVTVTVYRNCYTSVPPAINMSYSSTSCSSSNFAIANLDSTTILLSALCSLPQNCNGLLWQGMERNIYTTIIALPGACNDWVFSFNTCCRNAIISNLDNPIASLFVLADLDNIAAPCNSSPIFDTLPTHISVDSVYESSFSATDINGDSLVYLFTDVLQSASMSIPWASGYSVSSPVSSSGPILLDSVGILSFTPDKVQYSQVAVLVNEYRSGSLIGSIRRDVLLIGMSKSLIFPEAGFIYSDTGSTVTFTDTSSGAIEWDWDFGDGNSDTIQHPVHSYSLLGAYNVCLTVSNSCNLDTVCQVVEVCGAGGCIWPGDANDDLIANNIDLLNVGLAMNDTGGVRSGATTNWIGQYAPDWTDTFASGLNYKFADCDGNGVVQPADTAVILLNYGLTHSKTGAALGTGQTDGLSLSFSVDTSSSGDTVYVTVNLGDAANPVSDIYGLALTVTYEVAYVDSLGISVDFSNSWIGSGTDKVDIQYDSYDNGFVDIGIVRTDQTNVSGYGEIARVIIVIEDNMVGIGVSILNCHITNELVIDNTGTPISFTKASDSVVISGMNPPTIIELLSQIRIYPNPATNMVKVEYPQIQPERVEIIDLLGRVLLSNISPDVNEETIDVRTLHNGLYFVQVVAGGQTVAKRLIVLK